MTGVLKGGKGGIGEDAEQGHPCQGAEEPFGRQTGKAGDNACKKAKQAIDRTADHCRPVALRRVWVGVLIGAHGRGDGREAGGGRAERRGQDAGAADGGEQGAGFGFIAKAAQDRDAGDVLGRHGHNEQRQADA